MGWRDFDSAREFVRGLGLGSQRGCQEWLSAQLAKCRENPGQMVKPTSCAVAAEAFGAAQRWREVLPLVEEHLNGKPAEPYSRYGDRQEDHGEEG